MPESMKRMFRPGGAMYMLIGLVALVAVSWGVVVSVPRGETQATEALTDLELAVCLTRAGLDAGPLTAAGVTSQKVQDVVGAAREHLEEHIQTIRDADEDFVAAQNDTDRLERVVRSGLATAQDLEAYSNAKAKLATAISERHAALQALFTDAAAGLSEPQRATVNLIKAGRAAGWTVPLQYLAVARPEASWVALRDALANQRISTRLGKEPSPAAQQVISTENSNPTVSAAKANLDANLATAASTWSTSVYP